MNPIKQLAGQTGLYGISSILGRVLNYFLIYLHTAVFMEAEFGVMNYLYAQVAFLNILFTYGMETAFFRFSSRFKEENYYQLVATLLLISSLLLSGFIFLFANDIALFVGITEKTYIIQWLAGILFIDAVVAIPFAKLRLENEALRFVSIRIIVFPTRLPHTKNNQNGNN
jgi:O-antigen/teichoic acid export membrane protein